MGGTTGGEGGITELPSGRVSSTNRTMDQEAIAKAFANRMGGVTMPTQNPVSVETAKPIENNTEPKTPSEPTMPIKTPEQITPPLVGIEFAKVPAETTPSVTAAIGTINPMENNASLSKPSNSAEQFVKVPTETITQVSEIPQTPTVKTPEEILKEENARINQENQIKIAREYAAIPEEKKEEIYSPTMKRVLDSLPNNSLPPTNEATVLPIGLSNVQPTPEDIALRNKLHDEAGKQLAEMQAKGVNLDPSMVFAAKKQDVTDKGQ